jgi:hypothetical protein
VSPKEIIKKLCTNFNSVWWKCCMIFACHFDKNLFALLLFKGICHSNNKKKVSRYNELSSELIYRIELQQRAGLGDGTK